MWDANTAEVKQMIQVPKGARQITAISFNNNSEYIACADLHNDHYVRVYKVSDGTLIFEKPSGPDKVFMCQFSLRDNTLCTVGPNNINFWEGSTGLKRKGIFGSQTATNLACVAFDEDGHAYTGGQNGSVYKWGATSGGAAPSIASVHPIHKGVVYCIKYLSDQTDNTKVLISGGSDLFIHITNAMDMTMLTSVSVESIPKSVDYSRYLLVGMKNGSIVEFDV